MARSTRADRSTVPPASRTRKASRVRGSQAGSSPGQRRRSPSACRSTSALSSSRSGPARRSIHDHRSAWRSSTASAARPSVIGSPREPTVTSWRKSTSTRAPQAMATEKGCSPYRVAEAWASQARTRWSRSLVTSRAGRPAPSPCSSDSSPVRRLWTRSGWARGRGRPVIRRRSSRASPDRGSQRVREPARRSTGAAGPAAPAAGQGTGAPGGPDARLGRSMSSTTMAPRLHDGCDSGIGPGHR